LYTKHKNTILKLSETKGLGISINPIPAGLQYLLQKTKSTISLWFFAKGYSQPSGLLDKIFRIFIRDTKN
jgi:hypothetical protein